MFSREKNIHQSTEFYGFSSLRSVRSEQIIDSDDKHIMKNSTVAVSTSFKNISSHCISSNTQYQTISFKLPEEQCIASIVPNINSACEANEASGINFKIKPIKPIPILDLRKRRVDLYTPAFDLRKRRVEINKPIPNLREKSNKTEPETLDFLKEEIKKVKSDFDLSKGAANEECQILDLSIKRVEITKTAHNLTKTPSKVNDRNLDLTGKQSEIRKSELDSQKACAEFPVSVLHIDETVNPFSSEKIVAFRPQNIETEAKNITSEQDLPNPDYYLESPLDFPVPVLHNDEKASSVPKEEITDLNYQGLESNDEEKSNEEGLSELDYYLESPFYLPVPTLQNEGVSYIPKEENADLNYQGLESNDEKGLSEESLPELDYYPESPFDLPVPTLQNEEKVSYILKDENADLEYQSLESSDEKGSNEESLPELDYYPETSLDSSVLTLHHEERVSPILKEKLEDFKSQDIEVRGGEGSNDTVPELYTAEASADFPVSRLHIDEIINPISKGKIVSLNSDVKNGDRSYEVFPELDITESPIDFSLPKLHYDENINSITEEKMASLKSEGVVIRNGEWSVEEEALLRRNYWNFLNQYRINDSRLLFRRNLKTYIQSNKFLKAKHFYVRLGKDINERTLKSIYHKARSMFL